MLLLWILVLIVGVAYLAHRRISPLPALGIVAVYLLAMGIFSHAPGWLLAVLWILLAVVATPLLRRWTNCWAVAASRCSSRTNTPISWCPTQPQRRAQRLPP